MRTAPILIVVALASGAPAFAATAADQVAPARVVTLPTERIGSDVPGPQSAAAARHEAAAAWAENRRACRREDDRDARRDCLEEARADHDRMMAESGSDTR